MVDKAKHAKHLQNHPCESAGESNHSRLIDFSHLAAPQV